MDLTRHYFKIFDLPVAYVIDTGLLKARYLALQRKFHPDRFAGGSAQEQRLAVQSAAALNQAYEVLCSPVQRGQYLLELAGVDNAGAEKTNADTDFLMAQMNLREQLGDVSDAAEPLAELGSLWRKVDQEFAVLENEFSSAYSDSALEHAATVLEKIQFYSKLKIQLQELEEHLEECL